MRIISSIIISLIIFHSLNANDLTYINLTEAQFEKVNAEKIFENIKILPLETHKNALLDIKSTTYYLTDKYVIAMNFLQGAYMFDRETGKFIREISSFGQGADEYSGWLYNRYGFDEKNKILFASDGSYVGKSWKCINIETNKIEANIKKPLPENNNSFFSAYAPWFIKENIYVSFCNNISGKDKVKLVVYDKEGTVIKKYPNYLEYKNKMASHPFNNGIFYYFKGRTYFKEWNYNDTVFSVNENNIKPHIIFVLGDKQPSYYHQDDIDYNKDKYLINFVYESNSFVLFNFSYFANTIEIPKYRSIKNNSIHTGYYDKKNKHVYISSTPDFKKSGYDIKGIPISFQPIYINRNKEMIAQINPEELIKYKDKIGIKYRHLLENIQEDDNPIVVIAKLHE